MRGNRAWATVARLGAVGDNLMAASVCAPLHKMGYNVEMLTASPNHVVFHHNPNIDKVTVLDEKTLPKDDLEWQHYFARRSHESDLFVHLSHSCEMTHALHPQQSPFWWRAEARRKYMAGNYLETVHDIAGVPYEFGPLFHASDSEIEYALRAKHGMGAGRPVIGWVVEGSRIDRKYPHASLVIARLIRELEATVFVIAAPFPETFKEATNIMTQVVRQNGSDVGFILATSPDASLTWSLRRTLTQLQFCDLVIGPDTGPMWAVAFEKMPKISMLSNMPADSVTKHWINTTTLTADNARVPCYPCHRLHHDKSTCVPNAEDTGAACISDISIQRVIDAAREALQCQTKGSISSAAGSMVGSA